MATKPKKTDSPKQQGQSGNEATNQAALESQIKPATGSDDAGQGGDPNPPKAPEVEPKQPNVSSKSDRISDSLQAIGRDVLTQNPKLKAVYVTANGYAFPIECDALNHAAQLKNKTVETVIR